MEFGAEWAAQMKQFVASMVDYAGDWFDILNQGDLLSFLVILLLVLVVAAAVWQFVMNAPGHS